LRRTSTGLLYLQVHTCPDISFVVSLLSRHMTKAAELHIAFAKKVLQYLQSRKHLHLDWSAKSSQTPHVPGEIYGWSDASFAGVESHDNTNRVSSIGWLFMCNNGPISWRSTTTPLIAEYCKRNYRALQRIPRSNILTQARKRARVYTNSPHYYI
jgi:hypothetical protein